MADWTRQRIINGKSVSSFTILACERCGTYTEPPSLSGETGGIARPGEPLRCNECDGVLTLFECNLHPATEAWQEKPGAVWQHVATFGSIADVAHHVRVDEHQPGGGPR